MKTLKSIVELMGLLSFIALGSLFGATFARIHNAGDVFSISVCVFCGLAIPNIIYVLCCKERTPLKSKSTPTP